MTTSNERSLTVQLAERNIEPAEWHTLSKNLFPGAAPASVLMVIDYCKARKLDPLKKPCHIVRMKVGNQYRDVVLPGIYELRTTAQRTGQYLGHSKPEHGPIIEHMGVSAPEFCSMIVYRWHPESKTKAEYPIEVYFSESVGTRWKDGKELVNSRWKKAPRQMLTKCAEAAGLREAFPDEIGGDKAVEEYDSDEVYSGGQSDAPAQQTTSLEEMAGNFLHGLGKADETDVIDSTAEEVADTKKEFTAAEVHDQIVEASNKDELDIASDLVNTLPEEERRDLRDLAVKRYAEFVG